MSTPPASRAGTWAMSALHTPDPVAAAAFYGAVFGCLSRSPPEAPVALFRLPGYFGGEPGSGSRAMSSRS